MQYRSLLPVLLALLLIAHPASHAQPSSDLTATRMLSVGLGFTGGGSTMLDPATNWKVGPVFAWRATVDASYPLTNVIGAWLSLGIDRRGGEFHWYENADVSETRMVNYFTVSPGINLRGVVLGVNFGFPMGGTRTYLNGPDAESRTLMLYSDGDKLGMLIEPRLSGVIPVLDREIGWLGIVAGAGYALGNTSELRDFMPGETPGRTYSSGTVTAHLGVTWLFGIPGTGRAQL